jgi:hypothetical protein
MHRNRGRSAREIAVTVPADLPTDQHAAAACTASPLACTAPQSSAPAAQSSPRPALPASAASAPALRPTPQPSGESRPHLQVVPPRTSAGSEYAVSNASTPTDDAALGLSSRGRDF